MRNDSFNLPAPPGFQGLHPDKPITQYVRRLPHWRQDGATYFITYHLGDSLPRNKQHELAQLRQEWERKAAVSDAQGEVVFRELIQRAETWLDQGLGSCVLNEPRAAGEVVKSLHHFDGDRYELDCYVVMSNHVHLLMRPLQPNEHSVESILQSWKGFTARQIHELLGGSGTLWEQECFDRIVRDLEYLYRCIQYIGRNPRRARRTREECHLWIRPEWEEMGWRFEPE